MKRDGNSIIRTGRLCTGMLSVALLLAGPTAEAGGTRPGHVRLRHGGAGRICQSPPAPAVGKTTADEAGPAFSDPTQQVVMPEAWRHRPIRHAPWAAGAELAVTLDQHLFPLLRPAIAAFARDHHASIAVQNGTCGVSAGALSRKQVDIGGFCCPPGPQDRLPGLQFHTLGIAAIAVVVNRANPLRDVSLSQVRGLFSGRIYQWSRVTDADGRRGADLPVHPITRLHCKERPGHWRLLLENEDRFGPRDIEVGTIGDMMRRIATDPAAIGFETLWNITRYRVAGRVRALSINGVSPRDGHALSQGRYPLYRTFDVTTWSDGNAAPLAEALVRQLKMAVRNGPARYHVVPAAVLRSNGWRFRGDELVGAPAEALRSPVTSRRHRRDAIALAGARR